MNDDDELLEALGDALAPPDREPPPERIAQLRARMAAAEAATGEREAPIPLPAAPDVERVASRRRLLFGSAAAAVGAVVGAAGTFAAVGRDDDAVPTEELAFGDVPAGTTVSGRTIDHTWGLEVLLDVSGLPVDRDYDVTYATADGPVGAGGFRSVDVEMRCRFNAPPRRAEVSEVAIADAATGDVVLRGRPV